MNLRILGKNLSKAHPKTLQDVAALFKQLNNVQYFRPDLRKLFPEFYEKLSQRLNVVKLSKEDWVALLFPEFQPVCEVCKSPTNITPTGSLLFGYQRFCSRKCSNKADLTNKRRSETSLRKYGVANISQSSSIKRKKKKTCLKKYGTDNYSKSEEFRASQSLNKESWLAKCVATSMDRYGTQWPIQNAKLFATWRHYLTKQVVLQNGKSIECQGYEPKVIAWLDSRSDISKIYVGTSLPAIPYFDKLGDPHVYHPDIGVRKSNGRRILIEVKSDYTLRLALQIGLQKFKAATAFCTSKGRDYYVVVVLRGTLHWVKNPTKLSDFKGLY